MSASSSTIECQSQSGTCSTPPFIDIQYSLNPPTPFIRHDRILCTPVNPSSKRKQTAKSTNPQNTYQSPSQQLTQPKNKPNLQITNQHPSHPKTRNDLPISKLRVDLKGQESPKDIKVRCKNKRLIQVSNRNTRQYPSYRMPQLHTTKTQTNPISKLRVDLKRQESPKDIKVRCTPCTRTLINKESLVTADPLSTFSYGLVVYIPFTDSFDPPNTAL